ncbi:TlpA family protein disulfide reductase [Halalkalicoccus ordinarius]|uniref:TlpA family protein disulfide reductase n=1 Tax=Halalkalicoccus ordinarius TaxID=3116651 RepID=UPI00300E7218
MLQLSGGIALAGMAGCIGRGDEEDEKGSGDPKKDDDSSKKDDGAKKRAKTGDDAPDFELETPDGETVKLKPIEKPTVVLFVDVEHEAGKSHSKKLVDFHEEHADHARVITVNSDLDASKDDVRAFHEAYGGDWECAMGNADVLESYDVDAAVMMAVVDEHGDLAARLEAEVTASGIQMFLDAYAES